MSVGFPTGEQHKLLEFDSQKLEVRTHEAKVMDSQKASGLAIVCHPHPLYGGTMDNKVVHTLCRAYKDQGIHAIRFNFRGVGQSSGVYGEGEGEQEDLALIVKWARDLEPELPLFLAGFSFGAYVAARFAEFKQERASGNGDYQEIKNLILVAPPVHHFGLADVVNISCPLTVVQGLEDEVVPAEKVIDWVKTVKIRLPSANNSAEANNATNTEASNAIEPLLITLEETSHFFHGKLNKLKVSVETAIGKD